jgi:hypothetical protein
MAAMVSKAGSFFSFAFFALFARNSSRQMLVAVREDRFSGCKEPLDSAR